LVSSSNSTSLSLDVSSTGVKNGNVLSDLKINNKDNIAANSKQNIVNEEFEQFKKKFLNNGTLNSGNSCTTNNHSSTGAVSQTGNQEILKRKSFGESDLGRPIKQEHSENGFQNSAKRLINSSCSLNDLNNHLITTLSSSNNDNALLSHQHQHQLNKANNQNSNNDLKSNQSAQCKSSSSSSSSSIGEHKLLNGLLSKPLTNTQQNESG